MKKLKTITPMIMILILVTACTPCDKKTVVASNDLDLDVSKLAITTENEIDKAIKDIVEKENKTINVDKKETDTPKKEKDEKLRI